MKTYKGHTILEIAKERGRPVQGRLETGEAGTVYLHPSAPRGGSLGALVSLFCETEGRLVEYVGRLAWTSEVSK